MLIRPACATNARINDTEFQLCISKYGQADDLADSGCCDVQNEASHPIFIDPWPSLHSRVTVLDASPSRSDETAITPCLGQQGFLAAYDP